MDKTKALHKLLNIVIKKKYPEVNEILVDYAKIIWPIPHYEYEIGVGIDDDAEKVPVGKQVSIGDHSSFVAWPNIKNDIYELSRMVLTDKDDEIRDVYELQ